MGARRYCKKDCEYTTQKKCGCNAHLSDCTIHRNSGFCSCWHHPSCEFRFYPCEVLGQCAYIDYRIGIDCECTKECNPGCQLKKLKESSQNLIGGQNTLYQQFDTIEQYHTLVENGLQNKHMGKSGANDTSSRSHSVLEIRVRSSGIGGNRTELDKYGKISLVDLAGFEHQDGRGGESFKAKMNILTELRGDFNWPEYPRVNESKEVDNNKNDNSGENNDENINLDQLDVLLSKIDLDAIVEEGVIHPSTEALLQQLQEKRDKKKITKGETRIQGFSKAIASDAQDELNKERERHDKLIERLRAIRLAEKADNDTTGHGQAVVLNSSLVDFFDLWNRDPQHQSIPNTFSGYLIGTMEAAITVDLIGNIQRPAKYFRDTESTFYFLSRMLDFEYKLLVLEESDFSIYSSGVITEIVPCAALLGLEAIDDQKKKSPQIFPTKLVKREYPSIGEMHSLVYSKILHPSFFNKIKKNLPSDVVSWFDNFKEYIFNIDNKEETILRKENMKKLVHVQNKIDEWMEYIYQKYIHTTKKKKSKRGREGRKTNNNNKKMEL